MKKNCKLVLALVCIFQTMAAQQPVKVWEEPLVIPTYKINPANVDPMFFKGDNYQGASRVIYPYASLDNLGSVRSEKTYQAVYLQNDFIKICVLPELGGKMYDALDRSDNYHFIYRNHVIKPSDIGMLGAWTSGGIEWCVLHHHRASTFMTVDHCTTENQDGSKTIWIGETEPRQRMRWIIGLTSFPGKSYIEANVKIFNRMPETNTFLYWANVATSVNPDYRVIFPPSTDFAVYHAKNSFTRWPVSHEVYNGVDYSRGVDLSWWKNHPEPVSFFAYDLKEDFMGGYDYGKNAGTVHIGDHNLVKGAKLWEWGPSEYAQMWDKVLTDADGPYAEIMVGAFSDNQPDYSWIRPYETKSFKQYWYPVHDIGGFKKATLNGAVNLELTGDNKVKYGFCVTGVFPQARIVLMANGKTMSEDIRDLDPAHAFVKTTDIPRGISETMLRVVLYDQYGNEILSYQPVPKDPPAPLPPVVKPPPPPEDIKTVEELFLTGQRIDQFHNPDYDPVAYMKEALHRDPSESRVNTWMGNYCFKKAMYTEAAGYYRAAIKRITHDYTRPANCEALFGLGMVLKNTGRYAAAVDTLYRATWDAAWHSAAYFQLACISVMQNNLSLALKQVNQSLTTNTVNDQALALRASILRKMGEPAQALATIDSACLHDPLDFRLAYEHWFCQNDLHRTGESMNEKAILDQKMRNYGWSYLELADDYIQSGLLAEATAVLSDYAGRTEENRVDPMAFYTLAWLYDNLGEELKRDSCLEKAGELPTDYCFPYMKGSIPVLESAIRLRPNDAKALYYLGDLLYDKQPENAMEYWQKCVQADPALAIAWRNLGWGSWYFGRDVTKAVEMYETAIRINPDDPVYFYELDKMYEKANTPVVTRLDMLVRNHNVVIQREDAFLREIKVLTLAGKYSVAVDYLAGNHFHVAEGDESIHDLHMDVYLLNGIALLDSGKYREAIASFSKALEYPDNEQAGKPLNEPRWAQADYFLGLAWQKLGNRKNAEKYFKTAAGQAMDNSPYNFYRALSCMEQGDKEKAMAIFSHLIDEGEQALSSPSEEDYLRHFGEDPTSAERQAEAHMFMGMGYYGQGDRKQAAREFRAAGDMDHNLVWAGVLLKMCTE